MQIFLVEKELIPFQRASTNLSMAHKPAFEGAGA